MSDQLGGWKKSSGEGQCPYKAPIELPKWPAEEMNQQLYGDIKEDASWWGLTIVVFVATVVTAVLAIVAIMAA